MMYFAVVIALLTTSIVNGYSNNVRINKFQKNNDLPDYETPRWVYKKVYKHNKIPNYSQYKIKKQEKENRMIKDLMNEEEQLYQALKKFKLPMGFLQPINRDI